MRTRIALPALAGALLVAGSAQAQTPTADALADLAGVQEKYLALAEAMPASAWSWRPADGVRSTSEVFVHVANANYMFPSLLGVEPPAGAQKDEATFTDKAQVVAMLRASFDHYRSALQGLSAATLAKEVNMFGQQAPGSLVMLTATTHLHEHLGQAIAYARMNGVVPPWSGND